ncbi:hypothetical protein HD554DRAFT_2041066 [Boletus coccyginus]|nr:hypothetical protein HD554DRAFT_2041066 [Boletus coccyginus]
MKILTGMIKNPFFGVQNMRYNNGCSPKMVFQSYVFKSSALSKKLTAEMQSVHYAFYSSASTLIETLFDLRAQVEQSSDSQVQIRADLIKALSNQQNFNFLHQMKMLPSGSTNCHYFEHPSIVTAIIFALRQMTGGTLKKKSVPAEDHTQAYNKVVSFISHIRST